MSVGNPIVSNIVIAPIDGTAAAPSIAFGGSLANSSGTGFFLKSAGVIGLSINGTEAASWNSTGPVVVGDIELSDGTVLLPALSFASSPSTGLFYDGSNGLKIATNGILALTISSAQAATFAGALTVPSLTSNGTVSVVGAVSATVSLNATATTNQLILGNTRTVTISASQPAASSRVYTIPDQGAAANFLMSAAAQTIAGVQTFSAAPILSAGLTGVTTNSNAAAGIVGEILSQSRLRSAASSATSTTTLNITAASLDLTAGDWDVEAIVGFNPAATTSVTRLDAGISATTATLSGTDTIAVSDATGQVRVVLDTAANVAAGDITLTICRSRVSLASPTSYFLVAQATFAVSTLTVYGSITARRVR